MVKSPPQLAWPRPQQVPTLSGPPPRYLVWGRGLPAAPWAPPRGVSRRLFPPRGASRPRHLLEGDRGGSGTGSLGTSGGGHRDTRCSPRSSRARGPSASGSRSPPGPSSSSPFLGPSASLPSPGDGGASGTGACGDNGDTELASPLSVPTQPRGERGTWGQQQGGDRGDEDEDEDEGDRDGEEGRDGDTWGQCWGRGQGQHRHPPLSPSSRDLWAPSRPGCHRRPCPGVAPSRPHARWALAWLGTGDIERGTRGRGGPKHPSDASAPPMSPSLVPCVLCPVSLSPSPVPMSLCPQPCVLHVPGGPVPTPCPPCSPRPSSHPLSPCPHVLIPIPNVRGVPVPILSPHPHVPAPCPSRLNVPILIPMSPHPRVPTPMSLSPHPLVPMSLHPCPCVPIPVSPHSHVPVPIGMFPHPRVPSPCPQVPVSPCPWPYRVWRCMGWACGSARGRCCRSWRGTRRATSAWSRRWAPGPARGGSSAR